MTEQEAIEYEEQVQILNLLAEIQRKSEPIEMSIGWSIDGVIQQGIMIKRAQAVVVQKLVEKGCRLEILPQGVRVYV